jgi:diaminohydroxyphosphoribosylaminopyrimidine deaminase/5-amino-6-(5-phosphoribosylamino)uracil reductase
MPKWTQTDQHYMQLALDLARKGQGWVEPNPMVGCVIVKRGKIVGQGFHRKFGGPHAEPNALKAAGKAARGATVYVSLEPCSHVGKTPPCTDALIRAGVKRVVAAMRDPNPLVAGKGLRRLRAAGIDVSAGLLRDRAATLNAPFIAYHTENRPYVILKWAQSIDGKIATRTGDSKWITSIHSRKAAHALRARVDAVLVGVGTVLADNPDLTARHAQPRRVAARVVLDTRLRTPLAAKLVRPAREIPTLIATAPSRTSKPHSRGRAKRRLALERAGCEVIEVRATKSGLSIPAVLKELRVREMTNVLVEGGGRVLGAFLEQHLADEIRVFVAPCLIGGEAAPGPLRHRGPMTVQESVRPNCATISQFGPDICYNIRLRHTSTGV